jgi:hypothetical protein
MKCEFCDNEGPVQLVSPYELMACKKCIEGRLLTVEFNSECEFCKKELTESSVMLYGIRMCLECYQQEKHHLERGMKK